MTNWKGCGKKRPWPNLRYHPGIFLEELSKATKKLSQDSRSSGRDLNPRPPAYEWVWNYLLQALFIYRSLNEPILYWPTILHGSLILNGHINFETMFIPQTDKLSVKPTTRRGNYICLPCFFLRNKVPVSKTSNIAHFLNLTFYCCQIICYLLL
jgi:hypothetical protein